MVMEVAPYIQAAAFGAAVLTVGVALFQAALGLGLPLGGATLGGRARTKNGVLTSGFRVLAALQAIVLTLVAWITLARARVTNIGFLVARSHHFIVLSFARTSRVCPR